MFAAVGAALVAGLVGARSRRARARGPWAHSVPSQNVTTLPNSVVNASPFQGFANLGACLPLSASEQTTASQQGLDATAVYPVAGNEQQITIPVPVGGQVSVGLRYESGTGPAGTAARFRVISLEGATVLGGSTYVVRRP